MKTHTTSAFTLIELLIVVAIIAILAAIAVPNFLEAQVRSKVSRVKNDMRSLATALEAYKIDENHYPPDNTFFATQPGGRIGVPLYYLSTPVAYITRIPEEVFENRRIAIGNPQRKQYKYTSEHHLLSKWGELPPAFTTPNLILSAYGATRTNYIWALVSYGPDLYDNWGEWIIFGGEPFLNKLPAMAGSYAYGGVYDPTNGTMSAGDIIRVGP